MMGKVSVLERIKTSCRNQIGLVVTTVTLIVMSIIIGLINNAFFSPTNLMAIIHQSSSVCIMAIGITFVLITGGIDLSMGSILGFSGIVMSHLAVKLEVNPFVCILVCLLIGVVSGAFNGALITKLNLPPFITTLGTMTVLRGVAQKIVMVGNIYGMPEEVLWLGSAYVGKVPVAVIFEILMIFVAWFVLKRTTFGSSLYALGANAKAARLSGIKIDRYRWLAYVICGLFCSLSALITVGRLNQTFPALGQGYESDAITAAAIGGVSLAGGKGNVIGVIIGAVFIQVILNAMNLMGVSEFAQKIVTGAVILIAVGIDSYRQKRSAT